MIRSKCYVAEHDGAVFISGAYRVRSSGWHFSQQPFRIACLDGRDDLKIMGVDDDRSGCQRSAICGSGPQVTGLPAPST